MPAHTPLSTTDTAFCVHPFTNLAVHEERGPLIITKGEGIWVEDEHGKRYIEGLAGLWCTALGFSNERLVEAARRQMARMPFTHSFAHRASEPAIRLSEKLIQLAPEPMRRVFLVNSGSEAIDTALKLIWYHNNAVGRPEKKRIIARKRAYHGVTIAGGHLTGLPYARVGFDLPMADRFFHLTTPSFYRESREHEDEEAFTRRLAGELESLIEVLGGETIAAFFAEPVQGAGGVIVPPERYFEQIQPILRRHDILFVADEVINGFGRTGPMWGSQRFGITPDLVVCAKQLSSAYLPIAAVMMSEPFYEVLAEASARHGVLGMGYTYGGHPVAAAVALETLTIYEEDDILSHATRVAPHFQRRLARLQEFTTVGEARGLGLIGGIEIVRDKASRAQFETSAKVAARIADRCLEHGLVLRPLPGDVIGICPPLIIDEREIDELFDRLEAALSETERDL